MKCPVPNYETGITENKLPREHILRGYFLLRAVFLRLGSPAGDAAISGDYSRQNPFNLVFRAYLRACPAATRTPRGRSGRKQIVKRVRQALCQTAGLFAKKW